VRLRAYASIKKMMSQFNGRQINTLERNMMRGLFTRNLKDFAEDAKKNSKMTLLERINIGGAGEQGQSEMGDMNDVSAFQHSKLRSAPPNDHEKAASPPHIRLLLQLDAPA
jgi:hypothetical protein